MSKIEESTIKICEKTFSSQDNKKIMYCEFISFFGSKEDGRLFFVLPSLEMGWSSEHFYVAISWLFWQYSIAFASNF